MNKLDKVYGKGVLPSIPDLRNYIAKTTEEVFPESFELTMTPVKNQGSVGSCVAHSLSEIAEYFNKIESGKFEKLSTGFIYGNRLLSTYKGSGMRLKDAIKTMTKFGTVKYADFKENVEVPEAIELFDSRYDTLSNSGQNYRFKNYYLIKDDNTIKKSLLEGQPVIFSMNWYSDIVIENGILKSEFNKKDSVGGHCMVIYGWNQDGWQIQNSWGRSWGNNGTFILPYNIKRNETWGVSDDLSESELIIKKPFSSSFGAFLAKTIHTIISYFYNKRTKKE